MGMVVAAAQSVVFSDAADRLDADPYHDDRAANTRYVGGWIMGG
jgi:hypothetical protein